MLAEYQKELVSALELEETVKKNMNVLQHIIGYFKKFLSVMRRPSSWK